VFLRGQDQLSAAQVGVSPWEVQGRVLRKFSQDTIRHGKNINKLIARGNRHSASELVRTSEECVQRLLLVSSLNFQQMRGRGGGGGGEEGQELELSAYESLKLAEHISYNVLSKLQEFSHEGGSSQVSFQLQLINVWNNLGCFYIQSGRLQAAIFFLDKVG